jgi:hypothetical protein
MQNVQYPATGRGPVPRVNGSGFHGEQLTFRAASQCEVSEPVHKEDKVLILCLDGVGIMSSGKR